MIGYLSKKTGSFKAGKRSKRKRKSVEKRGRTRAILSLSSLCQALSHLLSFYFQLLKSFLDFCRIFHSYCLHCLTLELLFLHSSLSKCAFQPYICFISSFPPPSLCNFIYLLPPNCHLTLIHPPFLLCLCLYPGILNSRPWSHLGLGQSARTVNSV